MRTLCFALVLFLTISCQPKPAEQQPVPSVEQKTEQAVSQSKQTSQQPKTQEETQTEVAPAYEPTYQEVSNDFKTDYFKKHPEQKDSVLQLEDQEEYLFWEERFREKLAENQKNHPFINTAFQEFVVKDVIDENDLLTFVFDLHAPDCGAPDCFAHIVEIPLDKKWKSFPHSFSFTEKVEGCVDEETRIEGVFEKVERHEFTEYYYSKEIGKALELHLNEDGEYGYAILYDDILPKKDIVLQIDSLNKLVDAPYEESHTEIENFPYHSRQLGIVSYEDVYYSQQRDAFE